ncbi:MAG: hypothetical protein ACXU8O_02965 [Asticcacaulis sp.]
MSPAWKSLAAAAFAAATLNTASAFAAPSVADAASLPSGMASETRRVSDLPGLQGFLNLPAVDKTQFDIFYMVKIKHAPVSSLSLTLNDRNRHIPIHVAPDGRISPLPTREQVNGGATLTVVYPKDASEALKLRVFSTQPAGHDYDAQGLALGIRQANNAMAKIGGILVLALPRLDRVYFIGGGSGTVEAGGKTLPLQRFKGDNEIPAGTAYFVPSQVPGATRIHLENVPGLVSFANPPK